ncbi:MAG: dUTP diphosphatase [Muribaculaceae bacterium]|nr:dUTP diphosphatase [Muribaculaceae bacterium]
MKSVKVKIVNRSGHELPAYETFSAAGMDVRAKLDAPVTLKPLQRALIPTGLRIQLPQGYECQIRPRSGLALRSGISLVNTPGTVDADYRGEIGVILINLSDHDFVVNDGERICQMVISEYTHIEWEPVDRLDETKRGDGAFGHTGLE